MDIPIGTSGLEDMGVNSTGFVSGNNESYDPNNSEFSMDLKESHREALFPG